MLTSLLQGRMQGSNWQVPSSPVSGCCSCMMLQNVVQASLSSKCVSHLAAKLHQAINTYGCAVLQRELRQVWRHAGSGDQCWLQHFLIGLARLYGDSCWGRRRLHHQQHLHTDSILPRCTACLGFILWAFETQRIKAHSPEEATLAHSF